MNIPSSGLAVLTLDREGVTLRGSTGFIPTGLDSKWTWDMGADAQYIVYRAAIHTCPHAFRLPWNPIGLCRESKWAADRR